MNHPAASVQSETGGNSVDSPNLDTSITRSNTGYSKQPIRSDFRSSREKTIKRMVVAQSSNKSGCSSVQSTSPLAEASHKSITSVVDSNSNSQSQSFGYVNLTPYINVNTSDSPPPLSLPPKGVING